MSDDELTDDERCIHSIFGTIRFDYAAVAKALRSRSLTTLERNGLADMLEGNRPDGLSLKIVGQGRNWTPVVEGAARYDRAIGVAKMMDALLEQGESWEHATIATAEHFSISESTVSRDAARGRALQATGK